jgi:hypothetical protein
MPGNLHYNDADDFANNSAAPIRAFGGYAGRLGRINPEGHGLHCGTTSTACLCG